MNITQDRIDLSAATEHGIPVTNIPAIVTEAIADIGFGLLMAVPRNIALGHRLLRTGVYPGSQSNHLAGAPNHARPGWFQSHRSSHGVARPRFRHDQSFF